MNDLITREEETRTAICRFCNQMIAIQAPPGASPAECDEIAAMSCTCKQARQYQDKVNRMKAAVAWSVEHYAEPTRSMVRSAIRSVFEKAVRKVSFKEGDKKTDIYMDKDDYLVIAQTVTQKGEVEF